MRRHDPEKRLSQYHLPYLRWLLNRCDPKSVADAELFFPDRVFKQSIGRLTRMACIGLVRPSRRHLFLCLLRRLIEYDLTAARREIGYKRWQTVSRHLMEGVGEAAVVWPGWKWAWNALRDMLMNERTGTGTGKRKGSIIRKEYRLSLHLSVL
jgi:hypothetical protein